jgi:cold shock CspA family protein
MSEVGIGTIKLFNLTNKRGVIAPQTVTPKPGQSKGQSGDLYFEVSNDEASRLREGQLVQFVLEDTDIGPEAKHVKVLSDRA